MTITVEIKELYFTLTLTVPIISFVPDVLTLQTLDSIKQQNMHALFNVAHEDKCINILWLLLGKSEMRALIDYLP